MPSMHLSRLRNWMASSPPVEWGVNHLRSLLIGSLRQGPIPQHVAFVMDGNRRFARSHQIETIEGHNLGFEALARILEICYQSGVKVVTIYAFSIENFKRSKHEVNALMEMAKVKLSQLAHHGALLDQYGACIRILGQRELIRPDVLEAMDRAVDMTKHNHKAILNICVPYTSRDEMTSAIRDTVVEYSKPLDDTAPNGSRHTFDESRITNNIRSQKEVSSSALSDPPTIRHRGPRQQQPSVSSSGGTSESEWVDGEQRDETATTISSVSSSATLHYNGIDPTKTPQTVVPAKTIDSTLLHAVAVDEPTSSASSPDLNPTHVYPDPESITAATLTDHMFTKGMPPVDLVVRTSGVQRLSDFMLWQCHEDTEIVFLDVLWPEFDLWNFLPVLWWWQWRRKWTNQGPSGRGKVRGRSRVREADLVY